MNTESLLELLQLHPDLGVAFLLPDGSEVPPHFHVTEVGHVLKSFIDCGGGRHSTGSCVLQVWVADDTDHRLVASKLSTIFSRAGGLLPSLDLPVEIEVEAPVLTQLSITGCDITANGLRFQTAYKHTDCLAKELCMPDFRIPALPGCAPGSGCC